jgi:hypothetical protein
MKIDLKKTLPSFAAKVGRIDIIDVPPLRYLAADAEGDPNSSTSFREAIEALYPIAYTLKFMSKYTLDRDYTVPPMEALWWADDMGAFNAGLKDAWHSTVLIMLPDWITEGMIDQAREKVKPKISADNLARVHVLDLVEGTCAQTLYLGAYADEGPTIEAIHQLIEERGMVRAGKHHEIYLGDQRATAPEKLKTIIRQPAVPA